MYQQMGLSVSLRAKYSLMWVDVDVYHVVMTHAVKLQRE